MMFKQVAIASVFAVSALSAQAIVYPGQSLGALGSEAELFGAIKYGTGSFSDGYNFSLDSLSSVSGSVSQAFFGAVSFSSVTIGGTTVALNPTNTGYGFSFANLAAGNYTLTVQGLTGDRMSMYTGSVMAQPVPEPESIAMLLAGLGVVGAAVARRRKTR